MVREHGVDDMTQHHGMSKPAAKPSGQEKTKGVHFPRPITKASMLAEFFFALAMLWWEGLRALKIDISS